MDAIQFINDNKPGTGSGVISGTILLWEQWAGNSHNLAEYEGGYGYINTLTTERAYQHEDIPIVDQVQTAGIKKPTFNIPVGQGFFVEVIEDGYIEFNNGQRVFVKESDADGTPTNGSAFFRTTNASTTSSDESASNEKKILRLEFGVSNGATRSFVIGFTNESTDGFDYGLDGGVINDPTLDDMATIYEGKPYVIQAFSPITPDKEIDLILNASGDYTYSIKATEISNFPESIDIFLMDNLTGQYFDLRTMASYNFDSQEGTFTDRFKVIFQNPSTLNSEEFENPTYQIYVDQLQNKLYVKNLNGQAKKLMLTNMLGQSVKSLESINNQTLENGVSTAGLSTGVYVVSIITDNNKTLNKKILVD